MAIFPPAISRQALASTLVLYYLPALYPVLPFKSGASAFTSNHQTLPRPHHTPPGHFPLGLSMPHPDSLSFSTANCYSSVLESIGVGTETHAISVWVRERSNQQEDTTPFPPYIYPIYLSSATSTGCSYLLACLLASSKQTDRYNPRPFTSSVHTQPNKRVTTEAAA